ncbi:MAG: short chain dehydrogenase [Bryobacterales bacterium]|nr:short chain dehydrogenase [Bryobacterales bacterium]
MSSHVVLITGALTGIGRAAAIIFAQEGAHIVVSGRRDKQGQEPRPVGAGSIEPETPGARDVGQSKKTGCGKL